MTDGLQPAQQLDLIPQDQAPLPGKTTHRTGQGSAFMSLAPAMEKYRLDNYGPKVLSTKELLTIVIGQGTVKKGNRQIYADEIAASILLKAKGKDSNEAIGLQQLTKKDLTDIEGIGEARAAIIIATLELGKRISNPKPNTKTVIDDPAVAAAAVMGDIGYEPLEHFAILCVDIKHRLKSTHILSKGTRAETLADPREIFGKAIENGASRLVIAHNHPSGDTTPSEADISLTETLLKGGKILNIPILDHIVVSKGDFVSLRQTNGYLWENQ